MTRPLPVLALLLLCAAALAGCTEAGGVDEGPSGTITTSTSTTVAPTTTATSTSTSTSTTTSTTTTTSSTTTSTSTTTTTTTSTDPAGPAAPEWGDPDQKPLRPGINMVHDGAGCTTSFLFHVDWTTYYIATAAHCVAPGAVSEGCEREAQMPTIPAELRLTDGTRIMAPVAYLSWATMTDNGEMDDDVCKGNDFALLELPPEAVALAHPASLHFRAPTGLATTPTSDVWGFGASGLKFGVQQTHPKEGTHLGMAYKGWSHHVYLATPGIPGDSGGHIMTDDGKALGIASTVIISPTPGSNHYTDINRALEYMKAYEGWAPELVTWDDFHSSLV